MSMTETFTGLTLLISSIFVFKSTEFKRLYWKNILGLLFLLGFYEEFSFLTTDLIFNDYRVNAQNEINIHNLNFILNINLFENIYFTIPIIILCIDDFYLFTKSKFAFSLALSLILIITLDYLLMEEYKEAYCSFIFLMLILLKNKQLKLSLPITIPLLITSLASSFLIRGTRVLDHHGYILEMASRLHKKRGGIYSQYRVFQINNSHYCSSLFNKTLNYYTLGSDIDFSEYNHLLDIGQTYERRINHILKRIKEANGTDLNNGQNLHRLYQLCLREYPSSKEE